jgi:MFS family permease
MIVRSMSTPRTKAQRTENPARPENLLRAWYVVFALTAIYMLSFMDRQILSLLVTPMKRDLGISDTRVGLLGGLAFGLFYTLVSLPLGRIADTRNRRNLIAIGVLLWSVFTSACSLARSFWTLFLARMGVGVGEASLSPAAYSLIADYFPREQLGVAISVYYMGIYFGTSLSLLVTGLIVDAVAHTPFITVPLLGAMQSWRITFLIVGLPGVLFALLAYTFREPPRRDVLRTRDGQAKEVSFGVALNEMKRRWKPLIGISIGAIFQAVPTYALIFWTPTFFQRVHAWTPGQSGRGLAFLLMTFGCLGMYTGGRLSDYLQKDGIREGPLRVGVVCAVGTLLLLPLAFLLKQAEATQFLMGPGIFFLSLPMGTSPAALQPIFPNQVRGQVSALFLFFLNLGGLGLGPLMPGFLNDHLFHNGQMIGSSLAITIGSAAVLMLIAFRATYRSYRTEYESMIASH